MPVLNLEGEGSNVFRKIQEPFVRSKWASKTVLWAQNFWYSFNSHEEHLN